MARKYLNETGLASLWAKIKGYFVKKSGDTMTGSLKRTTALNPSGTSTGVYLLVNVVDVDNNTLFDWGVDKVNQNVRNTFRARRMVNNVYRDNYFTLIIDSNGNPSIDISAPSAWRYALGLATVASSGDYDDLSNKPTIPAAQVQANWNETDTTDPSYIQNKPTIPAAQVNSDWNATSGISQILNKPTIPSKTSQLTNDSNYLVNASGSNYVGKWGGYVNQVSTNNTTDTWVPVVSGSNLQHRVIPTAFNTYSTATGANAISANNQDNLQFIHVVRIGNFVNVSFQFANSTAKTGSASWVALKAGFRPSRTVFGTCTCVGSNINQSAMRMYIYSDGTMMQYLDSGTNVSQCMGSIAFLIT